MTFIPGFRKKYIPVFRAADVESLYAEELACSHSLSKVYDHALKTKLMDKDKLDFKSLKEICERHKIATIDGALGLSPKKGFEVKVTTKELH